MNQNIIVNESSANLRALGRNALIGKWRLGVGGTILFGVLILIPAAILNLVFGGEDMSSGVASIYNLLITGPMKLGYAMFAISIFRKMDTSVAEVFYGFERFGKALGLYLLMMIFILLWMFPVYIAVPFFIFFLGNDIATIFLIDNISTWILFIIAIIVLCIPSYIAYFRYSMSYYILADHPDIGPLEAIRRSKRMMQGNKWKFFCLNLSFIGWAILGALTCGIGYLWLMPYMEVSNIAFYDIANGSLRSVRAIEGDPEVRSHNPAANFDPITVYKDDSVSKSEENKEAEIIDVEATNFVETEAPALEESAPTQENPKTEE